MTVSTLIHWIGNDYIPLSAVLSNKFYQLFCLLIVFNEKEGNDNHCESFLEGFAISYCHSVLDTESILITGFPPEFTPYTDTGQE
jgi:hypothetical protein